MRDTDARYREEIPMRDTDDTDDINRNDEEFIVGQKMTRYFGLFLIIIGTKFLYEYFNL